MNANELTAQDVIDAWTIRRRGSSTDGSGDNARRGALLMQELAKGQPVSSTRFAELMEITEEDAVQSIEAMAGMGIQVDDAGAMIGNALTMEPTQHRFCVNDQQLFTWCSLDALFLPGLLGETAEVESVCPITGESIHLTVTPEGVTAYSPPSTVLSIVVPGMTQGCSTGETGPQSATCSQMHFFSSREAAEQWRENHADVAIVTVEEAFQLAHANWIAPYQQAIAGEKSPNVYFESD